MGISPQQPRKQNDLVSGGVGQGVEKLRWLPSRGSNGEKMGVRLLGLRVYQKVTWE